MPHITSLCTLCSEIVAGTRRRPASCTVREEDGSVVMDILWADDHGAMGLPVAEVLPRLPFSRALMQACSRCCSTPGPSLHALRGRWLRKEDGTASRIVPTADVQLVLGRSVFSMAFCDVSSCDMFTMKSNLLNL